MSGKSVTFPDICVKDANGTSTTLKFGIMEEAIIFAVIFYFVYRIFENLIHRKERIIIAQKIEALDPQKNGMIDLNKWFGAAGVNRYAPLRWGLLLVGAALGLVVAFFVKQGYFADMKWYNDEVQIMFFGFTFLFAGIGLLISFILERKFSAEDAKNSSR